MRLETTDYLSHFDTYVGALIAMITALTVFTARGVYNDLTRHISIESAYSIAIGSLISCVTLLAGILTLELRIPRSVPLIYAPLLFVFSTSMRLVIRNLGQEIGNEKKEKIAIYDTGVSGVELMEALKKSSNYEVKLFIDNNPELDGKNLSGVHICDLENASKKIRSLNIDTLLLAKPSNIGLIRQKIFEIVSERPLKVKIMPSISDLISDQVQIDKFKDIRIEDLLGRSPVEHRPELMAKTITKKTVLVTGAGGSIGSELCKQIIQWKPQKLIILDVSEYAVYRLLEMLNQSPYSVDIELIPLVGSVQHRPFLKNIFSKFTIDTTYHAAAYKHVPMMEHNILQCVENNVFGTLNMAELANAAKVKNFILISTDKAVHPSSVMGASKRFAEMICQTFPNNKMNTRFSIVRFGNVLGSSGSVVPLFKKQIKNGGPVTVTHEHATRYFMTIPEAAALVIQAGSISNGGEVFVLDMGQPIKILDLAKRMISLSGLRPVLSSKVGLRSDEIAITVSGLRPGEKLFEELFYSESLTTTLHPRIHKADETPISKDDLKLLLVAAREAIEENNHQRLFNSLFKDMPDVSCLNDPFVEKP